MADILRHYTLYQRVGSPWAQNKKKRALYTTKFAIMQSHANTICAKSVFSKAYHDADACAYHVYVHIYIYIYIHVHVL